MSNYLKYLKYKNLYLNKKYLGGTLLPEGETRIPSRIQDNIISYLEPSQDITIHKKTPIKKKGSKEECHKVKLEPYYKRCLNTKQIGKLKQTFCCGDTFYQLPNTDGTICYFDFDLLYYLISPQSNLYEIQRNTLKTLINKYHLPSQDYNNYYDEVFRDHLWGDRLSMYLDAEGWGTGRDGSLRYTDFLDKSLKKIIKYDFVLDYENGTSGKGTRSFIFRIFQIIFGIKQPVLSVEKDKEKKGGSRGHRHAKLDADSDWDDDEYYRDYDEEEQLRQEEIRGINVRCNWNKELWSLYYTCWLYYEIFLINYIDDFDFLQIFKDDYSSGDIYGLEFDEIYQKFLTEGDIQLMINGYHNSMSTELANDVYWIEDGDEEDQKIHDSPEFMEKFSSPSTEFDYSKYRCNWEY